MNDNRREPTISPLKPDQDEIARHKQQRPNSRPAGPSAGRTNGSQRPVTVRSKLAPFAFLLAITGLGLAGFAYWQLLQTQKSLASAGDRISELEGRLEMTGDESEQSMAAVQAKLKWADSEIRKLWGVAYDTNRKAIADNKETIAAVSKKATSVQSTLQSSLKDMKAEITVLNDLLEGQQAALSQADSSRAELQKQLQSLGDKMRNLESRAASLDDRIGANEQAIEAIDAFRRSVNRELLEMRGTTAP